jgi:hypothetical protein
MANQSSGRTTLWTGRVVSALPVAILLFSASMKLAGGPEMLQNWVKSGYPAGTLLPIGIVELACAILYAVPRTSVIGAVLATGYLGGAVATHVRAGEAVFMVPLAFGILAWLGLYLRDPRIRALLPLRRDP